MTNEEAEQKLAALLKEIDELISVDHMAKDQADEWLEDLIDELESRREALDIGEDKVPEE